MTTEPAPAPDPNDVLMGGAGAATLKIEEQGVWYGGRIVSRPQARQETVFGTQTPKTYPSGDPIWGVIVDVQTDQHNPDEPDDDGVRRLYIEGRGKKEAVRAAITDAGAPGLEQGGELHLAWTGTAAPANPGISGAKVYQARYVPAATAALNGGPAAVQQAAAHVATAPNTPAGDAPLPAGAPNREQVAAMRITMTDEQITAAFPAFIPALYPPR